MCTIGSVSRPSKQDIFPLTHSRHPAEGHIDMLVTEVMIHDMKLAQNTLSRAHIQMTLVQTETHT